MTMIKRDPSFELKKHLSSNWANDDAFLTACFNALSFSFPKGEKFFMYVLHSRSNSYKRTH